MKRLVKKYAKAMIIWYHSLRNYGFYNKLLKINKIPDRKVQGEKEWCERWSEFGMKANPVYYRLFSHYIGGDVNIVPENICHDVIEPILNPRRYSKFYADKNIFDRLFPDGYFAKTLLRKMNGFYYNVSYERMDMDAARFYDVLDGVGKIIIKPSVEGSSGVGVRCFVRNGNVWHLYDNDEKLDFDYVEKHYGRDFIVQEFLEQHSGISRYCSTSVNTLRLTLYRSVVNDECVITSAIMRIGLEGSIVDNAHAGGCFVGIEVGSGCLGRYVADQYGRTFPTFNGIDFSQGQRIAPELWAKTLDFAKSVGRYVPHHRLLALDVMIDKDGVPRLVEFNVGYYSMWLFQFTVSPAFGEYTDEIIEYCKTRKDSIEYWMVI